MKKLIFILIAISTIGTLNAQTFIGKWIGTLKVMEQALPIVFNITKNDTIYTTKMDSPAQNAFTLPTNTTIINGDSIEILATMLGIYYKGELDNDSIVGTFTQGGLSLPLILKQKDDTSSFNRPQEPKPPFPYKTEDVIFTNQKDKNTIAGTITIPDSVAKHPAILLISGSGPNDRDETIFGHKPFWVIADHLTRNGFIVLRYDKRGVNSSTGKYETSTTTNFAEDAKAAINYLKARSDVDKSSIGIIGHSEGGIIAPMIASNRNDISFIVLLAAMGTKGSELIMDQNELLLTTQNIEPENIETILNINNEILNSLESWKGTENNRVTLRDQLNRIWDSTPLIQKLKMNKDQFIRSNFNTISSPWFREFLTIDPSDYLIKVKCPVLAINGEKDTQVISDKNLKIIESSLEKGGNSKYTIKTYPNLNHLFQECETGSVDEYIKIEETINKQVLIDITNWISSIIN